MSPSDLLLPGLLLLLGLWGLARRVDVYAALGDGAKAGLRILLRIFPALVGLLTAVSMLRASGAMEALANLCAPLLGKLGIPSELTPLMLVRPLSGSGALGVAGELISSYGPDSYVGRVAAVMLGSTETTFYTITVYFGATDIRKTRYAIPAALAADAVAFLAAAALVRLLPA